MKAIAVTPSLPDSIHLREVPIPSTSDVPDGRGVLVKVLCVGVDGTDKEINAAEYGAAPPGDDYLIIGHESFGMIEQTGPQVPDFKAGDYVVASVRRPGSSIYDWIGLQDMTTDDTYFERGINLCHGYLAEYYADSADFLVKVPKNLKSVGVLLEPTSVVEKAINQAYEIQRRLKVWRPRRATVLGASTLGLLATPLPAPPRDRGHGVRTHAATVSQLRPARGNRRTVRQYKGHEPHRRRPAVRPVRPHHRGHRFSRRSSSKPWRCLGRTGSWPWSASRAATASSRFPRIASITASCSATRSRSASVNASREDLEAGVKDLAQAELAHPGWLNKLLTHRIHGLERYEELMKTLTESKDAIKVYCDVAGDR